MGGGTTLAENRPRAIIKDRSTNMGAKTLRRWLAAAIAVTVFVLFSIHFVDRPLARLLARFHMYQGVLVSPQVHIPVLIVLASFAVLLGARSLSARERFPKWAVAAVLAGLALAWSLCLTEFVLKPLFGRAFPSDYLQYGQYAFLWFQYSDAYRSFPSGHADQAMAIASVLWGFYPRWRWIYVVALAGLAGALLLGEWHFLSDLVAGGFIGAAAGALMMQIWKSIEGSKFESSASASDRTG
jgi:membrane-associated phospholipid phosphatase